MVAALVVTDGGVVLVLNSIMPAYNESVVSFPAGKMICFTAELVIVTAVLVIIISLCPRASCSWERSHAGL